MSSEFKTMEEFIEASREHVAVAKEQVGATTGRSVITGIVRDCVGLLVFDLDAMEVSGQCMMPHGLALSVGTAVMLAAKELAARELDLPDPEMN